ncbi:CKLF-like MARVEL transmembrane domain-containing protein 7 [Anneissia japonica]|uniref:CKLF-like MARVEL transmembrane domain-containing protein 7 n=1 Tax=Anneissia japonica TaxID=1529436 RepID=UPI001425A46D|nr:CKLF-like MARVEL transmembrane domain-containing protein 7 [Anneissia japonica]
MDHEQILVNIAEVMEQYPPIGLAFLMSPPGVLKITEIICCFIGFLCVILAEDTESSSSAYIHFEVVAMICCILSLLFVIAYTTTLVKKFDFPWSLMELFFNVLAATGLLTTTSHIAANTNDVGALVSGTVFGFIACSVYIEEIYFIVKAWKKRIIFKAVQEFRELATRK